VTTPVYQQVLVNTTDGTWVPVDCAFRLGDAAVTRSLGGGGWKITHVPSGFACIATFPSAVAAEEALKEVDKIVDWPGMVETIMAGRFPNCEGEIRNICTRYGGCVQDRDLSSLTPRWTKELREIMGREG
jgi:hypothetical protein